MTQLPQKHLFDLPPNLVYLDGNSLGPLPKAATARATATLEQEWGRQLIRAWNTADWIGLPKTVGDKIAPIIGAPKGTIATGDTLSIKVFQALAAALSLNPGRKTVLSDTGNFPTDLYMAQGLIDALDAGHTLKTVSPEAIENHIDETVAAILLTHVDYRTGRLHDMAAITAKAHQAGAVTIWDLAHSAGALPLDIEGCGTEFAIGCTYKYLNGGPGAPAFIYARSDLTETIQPILAGWMGHADPFAMSPTYRPHATTERLRVGTPPILQLAVLDSALDIWANLDMTDLRQASIALSTRFIEETERRCPDLELASPRDPNHRGSQVSFRFEHGYAAMQALIDHGVIGDFRPPNIMRFGFTPLYLDENDILQACETLEQVMRDELWRDQKYRARGRVT